MRLSRVPTWPSGQLPRETRDTWFLLAVIGWITVLQAPYVPIWCSALTLGVLTWRAWLAGKQKALPGWPWRALLLGTAMHLLPPLPADDALFFVRKVVMDLSFQLSALCVLAAVVSLWRSHTTINPLQPERASALVTDGIYRYTRNPMYLSLLLLLFGYACELWNWPAFLAPAAWRDAFSRMLRFKDGQLRFMGLISMLAGLALLVLTR